MKKTLFFAVLLCMMGLGTTQVQAQYQTAIGIRGTLGPGITLKHHIQSDVAIEGILHSWYRGLLLTGLYEKHYPALQVDGLRWYIGGGGHIGLYNNARSNNPWFDQGTGGALIGIDVIGGLEYTIPSFPLNFSVDWKPAFHLAPYSGWWTGNGAISIRYVLK